MSSVTHRINRLAGAFVSAFAVLVAVPAHAERLLVVNEPDASRSERAEARGSADVRFLQQVAPGVDLVAVADAADTELTIAELTADPAVVAAEPNRAIEADSTPDPLFGYQWSLRNDGSYIDPDGTVLGADIDAVDAWTLSRGEGALVAIADTGIEREHVDLAGAVRTGWDYVDEDESPDDHNGHGTHIAGVLAAREGNGVGVAGIAPAAGLIAQRILDENGEGDTAREVQAFQDAVVAGAKVVNASFGSTYYSEAERQTIAGNPGALFVVAAGNAATDIDRFPRYPCSLRLSNLICVGASTAADTRASFSNYGPGTVDLFAPGKDIASTWRDGGYALYSGTSMAAPAVAATAALIVARHPKLEPAEIKTAILEGVDRPAGLANLSVSGGRLNARGALERAAVISAQAQQPKLELPAPQALPPAPAPSPAPIVTPPAPPAKIVSLKLKGRARTRGSSSTLMLRLTGATVAGVALQLRRCSGRRCRWIQQRTLKVRVRGTIASLALRRRTPKAGTWRAVVSVEGVRRAVTFKVARG